MNAQMVLYTFLLLGWLLLMASVLDMQQFLGNCHFLAEMKDLQAFKALARRQMYLGLSILVAYWGVFLAGLFAAMTTEFTLTKTMLVITGIGVGMASNAYRKKIREQLYNLPADDQGIEHLHLAVCGQWASRTLPEF